jgi:hypothetical protein
VTGVGVGVLMMTGALSGALAAEPYPFEGTWILPQHPCVAGSMHLRTYTAREVVSPRGKCSIRRIAQGSGAFELMEECRHDGRPSTETETIRMTSPDSLLLKRQISRLKIPRQIRYARCNVPAAAPAAPPPSQPRAPARTVTPPSAEPQHRAP